MKMCLPLVAWIAVGAAQLAAQGPSASRPGTAGAPRAAWSPWSAPADQLGTGRSGGSLVTVIEDRPGKPVLVVDYPWKAHAKASIEISTVPEDATDTREVRPLFFLDKFFKGDVTIAVYRCQDGSAEVLTTATFQQADIDFEVIGRRNSLGRPSACVVCRTQVPEIKSVTSRALYCLLESWAADKRTLILDLPPEYFAEAGKIRVWFLRGDTVLWSETADWPGVAE